ncbi:MAG: hypothetical protein ACI8WB_004594, partial [Phenylobacterium sp.]
DIATRSKFNFSYLDTNQAGQNFVDWNTMAGDSKLVKLMDKLKEFTRKPLSDWQEMKIGKGKGGGKGKRQSCLEIYGEFPAKSAFKHPSHVPEDVLWARFRIDSSTRLVGFVLPAKYKTLTDKSRNTYDTDTFYIVFLDENHQFYLT